jgi:cell division protein ZapA (FtsZ GTPase activity inhibitor)
MTEPTRVELTILGEKLSIRTTAAPDYLQTLAAFVEERAQTLGAGTRSLISTLLLTALDVTDELFRIRDEQTRQEGDVDARLGVLVNELRQACRPEALTPSRPAGT